MWLKIFIFISLVAALAARKAPHADRVASLLKTSGESRFSDNIAEDASLDVPGLITKYGYPQETHHVVTSDGYILEAHRIPHGRDANNSPDPNRPVVFIMHGLLSSSADFLVLGPGNALGYLLAEAGYDVWLGNARGNYYSRHHISLDPDDNNQNFWRFSWDEIGNYDLPAFIDYILNITGQSKLHYIGHSQGGTSFLVLNSLRPEYNQKFISFQGLAPASFFLNNDVSLFNSLARYENILETSAFAINRAEIFGNDEFLDWFEGLLCTVSMLESICGKGLLSGLGDREYYNATMVPIFMAHAPVGASVRQVAHYGQIIKTGVFRRYNHNTITNLVVYGRVTPPTYDLSKVTVPSYLHYGLSDAEVNYKDLYLLAEKLPKVVGKFQVGRDTFNHFDFIWAKDAKELLYDNVIGYLKDAESRQ